MGESRLVREVRRHGPSTPYPDLAVLSSCPACLRLPPDDVELCPRCKAVKRVDP